MLQNLLHQARERGLPAEVIEILSHGNGSGYLRAITATSLNSRFTDLLLPIYHPLAAEVSQRWLKSTENGSVEAEISVLACFARILPFATYLRLNVKNFLQDSQVLRVLEPDLGSQSRLSDSAVQDLLLALFRLLSHDLNAFIELVKPVHLCSLFNHRSLAVRYLAVQCFCQVMHFADALSQDLVKKYIGDDPIQGIWEGKQIDFRILELFEEQRWTSLKNNLTAATTDPRFSSDTQLVRVKSADLSSRTENIAGVLLPRLDNARSSLPSKFVMTDTAISNLHNLATNFHHSRPILICGPAGAGKTAIVRETARRLSRLSGMITLHLNDQTDAKSLLGIYTSSTSGNGFVWQPGVLTNAVREGRWLLIEDIDRIPAEVVGMLRPLIENAELFIPGRKERIIPKDGFRILGTIRSTHTRTSNIVRDSFLSNPRMWKLVSVIDYPQAEIRQILQSRYDILEPFLDQIMAVHLRIVEIYNSDSALKHIQGRKPTIRDLLKWCRRSASRLLSKQIDASANIIPETFMIEMLKECVDTYASYLSDPESIFAIASSVAEILNIPPVTLDHVIRKSNCVVQNGKEKFQVGRTALKKLADINRRVSNIARFALTRIVRQNMEMITSAIAAKEPILLVGETGVGKTTIVQYIASCIGQNLTVVNLSNQSEASDLLGGLKPVTMRSLIVPLIGEFNSLFEATFSSGKNERFQQSISKAFAKQRWIRLIGHWEEAVELALNMLPNDTPPDAGNEQAVKRRKLNNSKYKILREKWLWFQSAIKQMMSHVHRGDQHQVFAFVESRLVKAVREGSWLLLDEVNLASSETLDNILSLFQDGEDDIPYLLLAESGNIERIQAHPNFRIFAAMNPATDTGKKDLLMAIRTHFTELYVHAGDDEISDLAEIIQVYLGAALDNDKKAANDLAKSYLSLKKLCAQNKLTDGAGDAPHFSLRSLTRCVQYVRQNVPSQNLRRAMFEGLQMSFFTVLSRRSQELASPYIEQHLLNTPQSRRPLTVQRYEIQEYSKYVLLQNHMILKGPEGQDLVQDQYIRTKSVSRNLVNLARAASMRRFPILLQGPTSAGKTSMVEYLAKYSGNKFVRINNHEHTDLQEYLGSYTSGADGRLEYREGVLVEALRKGYWIVLDELNLAPSDVLEALNRLLDDNRELLIPESQEVVRPHPNFMLFATQNPAGLYGGRKRLSRAFRNRFLEIHVEDIPEDELQEILTKRAQIPPSFCRQIVEVYKKLSLQRQSSRLFEQRNSFATLRDLFRWASRPFTDRQELAEHGYMLLAERVREQAEKYVVKVTIEETLKVGLNDELLYSTDKVPQLLKSTSDLTWTKAMRRLFILVSAALQNNEPVLLVGETGCGKTQVCQVVAQATGKSLHIYNAHSNTETGDLIGSQRPVRHKVELAETLMRDLQSLGQQYDSLRSTNNIGIEELIDQFKAMDTSNFESSAVEKVRSSIAAYQSLFIWNDGALVRAMRDGSLFLLDEISLADDSVLERMNSVLESARTLLLAEKGAKDNFVVAHPGFQFLATMNPGGDYGKRELSAALRNRLTEIWVPPLSDEQDILPILSQRLSNYDKTIPRTMLNFARYFSTEVQSSNSPATPLRTLLKWTDFVTAKDNLGIDIALVHGAGMNFIDCLGANPAGSISTTVTDIQRDREKCLRKLSDLIQIDALQLYNDQPKLEVTATHLRIGPFSMRRLTGIYNEEDLVLNIPTTLTNCMRIVRALQVKRPILLEGNPGVGKTALVSSLARICGKPLARINLSDQTDLMDLFGADTPAENESVGKFVWRDGPMLKAMQNGDWVLLDEMNLASQSVLEGLNACLDHRQEIYIPELDRTFKCHPNFMLFATQNPHYQGGGRKGLPASFVNRFTIVYADPFQQDDLVQICRLKYPSISQMLLTRIVSATDVAQKVMSTHHDFIDGGPWELNLRDLSKCLTLCDQMGTVDHSKFFDMVITQRFRNAASKSRVREISNNFLGQPDQVSLYHHLSSLQLQVGLAMMDRNSFSQTQRQPTFLDVRLLPYAESILFALKNSWPVILVGRSGCGKTTLIRSLAALSGAKLVEFSLNADMDTADLIGGYEQYDIHRDMVSIIHEVRAVIVEKCAYMSREDMTENLQFLLAILSVKTDTRSDLKLFIDSLTKCSQILAELQELMNRMQSLYDESANQNNRFVWNNGILIDAVQSGSWLVLDNSNLCNPSVLDRLNSLLEPNGCLIVSEQQSTNGESRIIRPHPDFRIILTADPRYGELSRAMRNRSLEIFMDTAAAQDSALVTPIYPSKSNISRLRHVLGASLEWSSSEVLMEPWLCQLSQQDLSIIGKPQTHFHGVELPDSLSPEVFNQRRQHFNHHVLTSIAGIVMEEADIIQRLLLDHSQPQILLVNDARLRLLLDKADFQKVSSLTRLQFLSMAVAKCQTMLGQLLTDSVPRTQSLSILWLSAIQTRARSRRNTQSIPAYEFLEALASFCAKILISHGGLAIRLDNFHVLQDLVGLLRTFIALFQQQSIPEDQLQAHKMISYEFVGDLQAVSKDAAKSFSEQVLAVLGGIWSMSSGLGLQKLWPTWKGESSSSLPELQLRLRLEDLIRSFDLNSRSLPHDRSQLAELRVKLLRAKSEDTDVQYASTHLKELESAVDMLLEDQALDPPVSEHFVDIFGILTSKMLLQNIEIGEKEYQTMVLFGSSVSDETFSTRARVLTPSIVLQSLAIFATSSRNPEAAPGMLLADVFMNQLNTVDEQKLGSLGYIRQAFLQLTKSFSIYNHEILRDSTGPINQYSLCLIRWALRPFLQSVGDHEAIKASDNFKIDSVNVRLLVERTLRSDIDIPTYLHDIAEQHFMPALDLIGQEKYESTGRSIFVVALACLKLLVTDKRFDPATYPQVVRAIHERRSNELSSRLSAWAAFQQCLTGQETSAVSRVIEEDIRDLGTMPPFINIYRPEDSSLADLQAEYNNILHNVINAEFINEIAKSRSSVDTSSDGPVTLFTGKIDAYVGRLSNMHRAYDDLVTPIKSLLRCLSLGLRIMVSSMKRADKPADVKYRGISTWRNSKDLNMGTALDSSGSPENLLAMLENCEVCIGLESKSSLTRADIISNVVDITDQLYIRWKRQLNKDQTIALAESKYYTYRGQDEESDADSQEIREMFPTFLDEDISTVSIDKPQRSNLDWQDMSMKLANIYGGIFGGARREDGIRQSMTRDISHSTLHGSLNLENMPAVMLTMQQKLRNFEVANSSSLNIYVDNDASEAQKLFDLVRSTQIRFRQIMKVWPEHASVTEALLSCRYVLNSKINEPIAALLTKTEKLLDVIAQWQAVASKEWSVQNLIDSFTQLIISWRRLELGSWSKLLDIEDEKVRGMAGAWYFIAYEAVIYNSLLIVEDMQNVSEYCTSLAKTLEEFLKMTSLGQFTHRLRLLQDFSSLIRVLVEKDSRLTQIAHTINNVVMHYTRYEAPIAKQLAAGRLQLEKAVKEQIQLASWKDTNILALRDSARRSHYKLFRIVKKYRILLAQPIVTLEASYESESFSNQQSRWEANTPADVDMRIHIIRCQTSLNNWDGRPERLKNPNMAAKTMRHAYELAAAQIKLSVVLRNYCEELTEATNELRKLTPTTLTKENASTIKDLKQRKRRLLADTMKELGQMGIRRNLGTTELEIQGSTSRILAATPTLPLEDAHNTDASSIAFHELLDVMRPARDAALKHSEELTGGEVRRGLGYLEGLLHLALKQRTALAESLTVLHQFSASSRMLSNMGALADTITASCEGVLQKDGNLRAPLSFISSIVQIFIDIIKFQSQHGDFDASDVIRGMQMYHAQLETTLQSLDALPVLPLHITSQQAVDISERVDEVRESFESDLVTWTLSFPQLGYLTGPLQIMLSELVPASIQKDHNDSVSLADFDGEVQAISNLIFVLMQRTTDKLDKMSFDEAQPNWLTQASKVQIQAAHPDLVGGIVQKLNNILGNIHTDSAEKLQLTVSLLIIASPIISQFEIIYQDLVQDQMAAHIETCRLTTYLGKSFTNLARDGFCTPAEPSNEKDQSGKVEQGTGLGEGEAAEDISKDVGDDEDLSELAQTNGEREEGGEDMEKSKHAVDLGVDELEGEIGSDDEQASDDDADSQSADEEDQNMDQETGSVDDLDPSAVDEKMWDAMQKDMEQEQKEMKAERTNGAKSDDPTERLENAETEQENDDLDASQNEGMEDNELNGEQRDEGETLDPRVEEESALELPEEMQLNGEQEKADEMSDVDMHDLSDIAEDQVSNHERADDLPDEDQEVRDEDLVLDDNEEQEEVEGEADASQKEEQSLNQTDEEGDNRLPTGDDMTHEIEDQDTGDSGTAATNQTKTNDNTDENKPQGRTQTEATTEKSNPQDEQQTQADGQGKGSKEVADKSGGRDDQDVQKQETAIQRLADILDQYHQRREIFTTSEDCQQGSAEQDVDMGEADFEHLGEDAEEDHTQVLGTATTDVNQQFDTSKAIEESGASADDDQPMPDHENGNMEEEIQESLTEKFDRIQVERTQKEQQISRSAIVPESARERPRAEAPQEGEEMQVDGVEFDDSTEQLQINNQDLSSAAMSLNDAQQLWASASAKTQALSTMLTEQLRLILQPTTATKLRGDFRTGKRLNIRRIIPYIASGYKRDKIWMRRSIPSKRNYQIMLAVDDSKSMAESGADILALETLCMLSRSLSMLEVGEISIVAFGQDYSSTDNHIANGIPSKSNMNAVKVAHPFSQAFSSNQSGPATFSNFTFAQTGTNIRALLAQSISMFTDARAKSSARDASDLWQLQIIVSDGHIGSDSDDSVRRLVRKARESKIVCVFVVVDSGEESIVDLKEVSFNDETGEVSTKRYLENFSFQYYVVVREVGDLPGVLSRVLKGWFEGVVEQG